jgi:cytochrome c oxidase subunit 1
MLLVDRYLGGHFFDTQAGGSAVIWMHFFWIFGHPEVYVLVIPAFAFASEIIPVFSRKAIFGYPVMVAATICIGFIGMSVWAHHMFTVGMSSAANTFFVLSTMAIAVPTGIKIFNWLATMWGGQIRLQDSDAVLRRFPVSVPDRGTDRGHDERGSVRLAARKFVLRHRALSLCHRGRHSLHAVWGLLLLVSEDVRKNVQRDARQAALLALLHRIPSDLRFHAYSGHSRDASPNLYLRAGPRLGHLESHRDRRCVLSGGGCVGVHWQPALVVLAGQVAGSDPWDAWTLEWSTPSPPPTYNFATIPEVKSRRPLWDLKHPEDPDWQYE